MISVVMPTYNTNLRLLTEAIQSILDQTFADFEFLIVDDGSTNGTGSWLDSLSDPRIRIIHNDHNLGPTKSMNIGFREAKGKYIARMDADDISLPERFQKQYYFMEYHPDIIVCGARAKLAGIQCNNTVSPPYPQLDELQAKLVFSNCAMRHSTAFFRHSAVEKHCLFYDESLRYAQDYAMWVKASRCGKISCVQEILLQYHTHDEQISKLHREEQILCDKVTQKKLLEELIGSVTDEELDRHYLWSTGYYPDAKMTQDAKEWYDRLICANRYKKIYKPEVFEKVVHQKILNLIYQTMEPGTSKWTKAQLFYQYLPFTLATQEVAQIIGTKIKKRISVGN